MFSLYGDEQIFNAAMREHAKGGRADLILAVLGEAAEYNDGLVIDIEE